MILGFVGNPRQGKTLIMVAYFYLQYLKGKKIYSYKLNTTFSETINVNDILSFDLEHGCLMIDEAHTLIDSRNASQLSRLLSYFWTQSGKRDLVLGYTTQIGGMVDLRLRDIADVIFKAEKVYKYDRINNKKKITGFRYSRIINDEYVSTKVFPIIKARKFFDMYDTYQKILPLELDASDVISLTHVKKIKEQSPTKRSFTSILRAKYTHIGYDDAGAIYDCLDNGLEKEAKEILRIRDVKI